MYTVSASGSELRYINYVRCMFVQLYGRMLYISRSAIQRNVYQISRSAIQRNNGIATHSRIVEGRLLHTCSVG